MKASIVEEIKSLVATSVVNCSNDGGYRYFAEPLVGFADAEDPLFGVYQDVIGSFHLSPAQWFDLEFGAGAFRGGTVICWILPCSEEVLAGNRKETSLPSRQWAHARFYGEGFNDLLRNHVVDYLSSRGHRCIAPSLSRRWQREVSEKVGIASNWSERHAAYAAGLGTFSLNDGLITEKGIAHRCGSVITDLVIEPDVRRYQGIYDHCLCYSSGKCGACMKRCPAGAISAAGHDKEACFNYTRNVVIPSVNGEYQVTTPSCGLCQTRVPCERRIP